MSLDFNEMAESEMAPPFFFGSWHKMLCNADQVVVDQIVAITAITTHSSKNIDFSHLRFKARDL